MNEEKKRKWNIAIFLVLLLLVAGAAVPGVRRIEESLFADAAEAEARAGAILVFGMVTIVCLAAVSGILALCKAPVTGPSLLIGFVLIGCGAAMFLGVKGTEETAEPTPAPRPTVTPPAVEITESASVSSGNPETGTEFFRLYDSCDAKLVVENGSNSDIYLQMLDRHETVVLRFYVRMGDTLEIPVPWGTYHFQLATGRYWENEETLFGSKTHYRAIEEVFSLQHQATLTLSFTSGFPETVTIKEREFTRS